MRLPVRDIAASQSLIADDQQVLRVLLLSGFGEFKAPGNDDLPFYGNDFIVANRVLRIDARGDLRVGEEVGGRVFVGAIRLSPA